MNKKLPVTDIKVGKGYISINFEGWTFCGCYISRTIDISEYKEKVDEIAQNVRSRKEEVIIAGDINAKSHLWESPISDRKGEHWADWIAALDLVVHNNGGAPTFVRGRTESYIDVTLSTRKISPRITNWKVMEEENLTEHRYICYEVKDNKVVKQIAEKQKRIIDWGTCRMSWYVLVTLDIQNVFNTASWNVILEKLRK
ncbi:Endonuclease-reverse transcriptase [Popillia japonica]|uniref:Endonuclease-reverse transcriptase n=1 Tax=Popillia japonica TaxID=7064 RepID=A0AAW1L9T9_POPJA